MQPSTALFHGFLVSKHLIKNTKPFNGLISHDKAGKTLNSVV